MRAANPRIRLNVTSTAPLVAKRCVGSVAILTPNFQATTAMAPRISGPRNRTALPSSMPITPKADIANMYRAMNPSQRSKTRPIVMSEL